MPAQIGARLTPTAAAPGTRANAVVEQQRLSVTGSYWQSATFIKHLYGAGDSDNVVDVNITAADPSQLADEDIGLRLRINNVNVTVGLGGCARRRCVPLGRQGVHGAVCMRACTVQCA